MSTDAKPHKNTIFYWLGGFILVCCLALAGQFFLWKYEDSSSKADPGQHPQTGQNEKVTALIQDYLTWSDALPSEKVNYDHEVYKAGLDKIANVLSILSLPGPISKGAKTEYDARLIHLLADSLTYDWKSERHSGMIKHAFLTYSIILSTLHFKGQEIPDAEEDLKDKINRMAVHKEALRQQAVIDAVFQQTAVVFKKIVDQLPK